MIADRLPAIVRLRLVTSDDAGPAGVGFGVIYRNIPFSETGDPGSDELVHSGGMGIVAHLARPSLVRFVHMHIVQVAVAIPKVSKGIGAFILGYIAVMAFKTECKMILGIREVKRLRKRFYQHAGVIGPVGDMTGDALPFTHGIMYILPLRHALVVT